MRQIVDSKRLLTSFSFSVELDLYEERKVPFYSKELVKGYKCPVI
jgi:hypothetical protein